MRGGDCLFSLLLGWESRPVPALQRLIVRIFLVFRLRGPSGRHVIVDLLVALSEWSPVKEL